MNTFTISGNLVDLFQRRIYAADISIANGIIISITETTATHSSYLLPGFIDAHIHIESSMLTPAAFAQVAVVHGTVATVSDPHEIANVCGIPGIDYMISNSKLSPFRFFFGAPSCVPATGFETAGAVLDAHDVALLLARDDIWYLSEMMNYPGVLHADAEVMAKIAAARQAGKPADGHAPGLTGPAAAQYAAAGITTDHECTTLPEALDKIAAGMHILIREGSAARNYEALAPLLSMHPERIMFCSDDKHPDELLLHHINGLVKRSLAKGYDLYHVLRAACVNPVLHYGLPVGLLRVGDAADFIVAGSLATMDIEQVYIAGQKVAEGGVSLLPAGAAQPINNFAALPRQVADFAVPAADGSHNIRVIEAIEGQLLTRCQVHAASIVNGCVVSDTSRDLLKIAVVNRYEAHAPVSVAFITGFGLRQGALASTVGHDCHNIIAVGADDESLCAAINALIACQGGIAVAAAGVATECMPLPVAGLMSLQPGHETAAAYTRIDACAKALGTPLKAPFMTLSFMALLVIPELKLGDRGLFDGAKFEFTSVIV